MCGIAGIISADPSLLKRPLLQAMADTLAHRGPDGQACWTSPSGHAGLAHRRLAVIDPGPAAAQPMHYKNRYTIVYNGAIYNYIELRNELLDAGYSFSNHSDTEVILAMYDRYGEKCLGYFDGMFAFSIWDEMEQKLFCARDRFGEKPLFYFFDQKTPAFYFASEIKGLYATGLSREVNHGLLLPFLALGYTGDPRNTSATFDRNIKKLPAAHYCIFSIREKRFWVKQYWEIDAGYREHIGETEAVKKFSHLLHESVRMRLRSDVALGSSLSGGLDSASIAAAISSIGTKGYFKTFTASFPGFEKDESMHAREVADGLGFENYTVAPSANELMQDLKTLMYHQEEPFSSSSVYAQYRLFQLAGNHGVTVLLDGQGADETLGGYDRYRRWPLHTLWPEKAARLLEKRETRAVMGSKDISRDYLNAWADQWGPCKPVIRSLNDMLYFNTMRSGLEELLRYADRNSMAHGCEVRLPFLSHQLVSFVFSLPDHYKLRDGWTKWILRESTGSHLPRHITWQKRKIGFEPPQKEWMQSDEMMKTIGEVQTKLVAEGILSSSVLHKRNNAHAAYERNSEAWRYLMAYLYLAP